MLKQYQPIAKEKNALWGPGDIIRSQLSDFQFDQWRRCYPYQDKRNDPGQGEVVTYFAAVISDLVGLNPLEKEVSILAAIFHDTGYAKMSKIDERFRAALKKGEFSEEMIALRIEHQNLSAQIAQECLKDFPNVSQVKEIILDHDTRFKDPVSIAGKVMWDADILWRVTVPMLHSWAQDLRNPEAIFRFLSNNAEREGREKPLQRFMLPLSQEVARIEMINSMMTLFPKERWPREMVEKYRGTIEIVERSLSVINLDG